MNWNVWYQAEWLISWVQARLEAAWHKLVRFQALKYIQHLCTSSYRSESGSFDPLTEIKEQTRNFFGSAFSTYRIMTETSCASRTTCNFVLLPCFSFKKKCYVKVKKKKRVVFFQETKKIIFIFTYLKSIKGLKPTKASAVKFVNICAPVLIIILYHVKN